MLLAMGGESNEQHMREVNDNRRRTKNPKRKWTEKEDEVLVATLLELCDTGWKRDNNIFKSGYTSVLEKELSSKLPGRDLKASPHIESRLKTLKKYCDAITDTLGAKGICWNNEKHVVMCEDDDIWNDWVKFHPDAKGLRNRPFPHYNDLYIVFGKNRGNQKSNGSYQPHADKMLEGEEGDAYNGTGDRERVCEKTDNNGRTSVIADGSNGEYRYRLDEVEFTLQELERRNCADKVIHGSDDDDVDVSSDGAVGSQMNIQDGLASKRSSKKRRHGDKLCEYMEVAKIFGTFLKKYDEQFNLLFGLVGKQTAADKASAENRANLNGELMKLPNLSLQARLRAATLIICDPPKLDLFYSLTGDDRREWVSMLLTGLL